MRLSTKTDITEALLSPSVEPGEYTGFLENFATSYNATKSLQNSGSQTDMMNEETEALHEIAKESLGFDDNSYTMWQGDMNFGGTQYVAPERELSVNGEVIPLPISRLYDLASENEEVKQKFEALGYDMSSRQNAYDTIQLGMIERSQAYQEQYNNTANKQAATGVLGDFAGSMVSFMTDPTDIASLFIGVSGKAKLLTKIAQASGINVGVEVLDYPNVNAWTKKVTGSPYTSKEFIRDAGLITAGTAGLVSLTNIPVRSMIAKIKDRAGRALAPKEELEFIEIIKEVTKENEGKQWLDDKTLEQINNKESMDDITNKGNFLENDVSNTKHNKKVKETISAVMRNDENALRPITTEIDVDDIYTIEKQGIVDEFEVKDLDPNTKVTGEAVDEVQQGQILVYEDAAGNRTIIDGNQRVKAAAKAGQKKMYGRVIRETEGFTKEMAEMMGRIRNYYDGTIKAYDMDILAKYPEMVEALARFDPLVKQTKNLAKLGPRIIVAMDRDIVDPNIGILVGEYLDDPIEQLAVIDKIKKANVTDDESVTKIILDSIEDGSLKEYDMANAEQSIKSLFVEGERKQIIDGVLSRLRKENITLKNKKDKASKTRREQNGKAIQIIEEYGNKESELYGQITKAAQAISSGGKTDEAVGNALNDIRTAIDEGRYDGLYYNGQLAKSNVAAQINRVSEDFKKRNKELIAYSEGLVAKQINLDVQTANNILNGRADISPEIANRVIDFDAQGNGITLRQALDDIATGDANELDFINACRKS